MKKILAVSALVSLIPLASISIVSCKKKKTETNKDEQQKPSTPNTPGNPSVPENPNPTPDVDANKPDSNGGGSNGGSSSSTTGIMEVSDFNLGVTNDSSGKWWFSVWVYGSNLSNNIEHYKFSAKKDGQEVVIPNEYFSLQMISQDRKRGYFTQRSTEKDQELYEWLKKQYNERKLRSVIVSPSESNIKPETPSSPPTSDPANPQINKISLSKTNYGTYVERSIVVNGSNLPSKWDKYTLTWKDSGVSTEIPSYLFRNSRYKDGSSYQVFELSPTADETFVNEFDRLLELKNSGNQVFELKLKS